MIKYKVDGVHRDLRITRAKIIVCDDGESLEQIINSRKDVEYFLLLPEDVTDKFLFKPSLWEKTGGASHYDSNKKYLAFARYNDFLGWKLDSFNCLDYYNWFSRQSIIKELNFTPERLQFWVDRFIREHRLKAFE